MRFGVATFAIAVHGPYAYGEGLLEAAFPLQLAAPEVEIQHAITGLDNIQRKIDATKKINNEVTFGAQKVAAERAFVAGKEYFKNGEYLSAVRELNVFLNLTQIPATPTYLEAQFLLARSYEQMNLDQRAIRAYMRFLSAFTTGKNTNYTTLLEVLQRLMPIAAKQSAQGKTELKKLFSAIINMDIPKDKQPEVYYFAANSAATSGNADLATEWFSVAEKDAKDGALKARAIYFQALLALSNENLDEATSLLERLAGLKDEASKDFSDLSSLTLARIATKQRKLDTALGYYGAIAVDSPSYKDALFESVYLKLEQSKNNEAKQLAENYLKRFPSGAGALQLKTLMSYLKLRSGELAGARESIANIDDELDILSNWIATNRTKDGRLTQAQVLSMLTKTNPILNQSPLLREGAQQFDNIAELQRRLADTRGNLRNVLFTTGRANVEEFRPVWLRKSEQLNGISDETLLWGHRLVASMKNFLGEQLGSLEKRELEASEKRRFNLLSNVAKLRRQRDMWVSWTNLVNLTQEISVQYMTIRKSQAELAAARYLVQNSKEQTTDENFDKLAKRLDTMERSLMRSLEVLRTQKVANLIVQSPHTAMMNFYIQYANGLHEEIAVLSSFFDRMDSPSLRFLVEDAKQAFKRWEFVSRSLYGGLLDLDNDMASSLNDFLVNVDNLNSQHEVLQMRLTMLNQRLEQTLGASFANLSDHYNSEISVRRSKNRKWKADIEWLEYSNTAKEKEALKQKFELEQQILKDNLRDL
jgi:outer membrane protein assembly factor BamD (BamD/ComL family)